MALIEEIPEPVEEAIENSEPQSLDDLDELRAELRNIGIDYKRAEARYSALIRRMDRAKRSVRYTPLSMYADSRGPSISDINGSYANMNPNTAYIQYDGKIFFLFTDRYREITSKMIPRFHSTKVWHPIAILYSDTSILDPILFVNALAVSDEDQPSSAHIAESWKGFSPYSEKIEIKFKEPPSGIKPGDLSGSCFEEAESDKDYIEAIYDLVMDSHLEVRDLDHIFDSHEPYISSAYIGWESWKLSEEIYHQEARLLTDKQLRLITSITERILDDKGMEMDDLFDSYQPIPCMIEESNSLSGMVFLDHG